MVTPMNAISSPPTLKPRRRWLQFSLRTMMVLMLVFGAGLGWLAHEVRQAREQRVVAETITESGGDVLYDWQLDGRPPPGPAWLQTLLGTNLFGTAVCVGYEGPKTFDDNDLALLQRLPGLRELGFGVCSLTVANIAQLASLTSLETLSIHGALDRAVWKSLGRLSRLKGVDLSYSNVEDCDLVFLGGMGQIQRLDIGDTRVTDAGLVHVRGLSNLESLRVPPRTTNDGLTQLQVLSNLRHLDLSFSKITGAGWGLFRAFPRLEELHIPPWKLTDQSLADLRALRNLQVLHLDWCTDDALKQLREALPGVSVHPGHGFGGGMGGEITMPDREGDFPGGFF
jgi:hypothetical protein